MLHRWRSSRAAYPEASGPADPGTVAEPKARKWMQRWRARWAAKMGTIRLREELPLGEARDNAGHKIGIEKRDQNRGQKTRPKMDPQIATSIGKMCRSQILRPFLGSDSEPKMGSENGPVCARFGSAGLLSDCWRLATGLWQDCRTMPARLLQDGDPTAARLPVTKYKLQSQGPMDQREP